MYDDTEIRSLFRFQRCHVVSIVEDMRLHLEVGTGRGRSLAPLQQICIALLILCHREYAVILRCMDKRPPIYSQANSVGSYMCFIKDISREFYYDGDASWTGSVHESRIFKNSDVYEKLITGELNGILLGDNGNAITPVLLTPFLTPNIAAERNYNHIHKRTRCTIERTFGQVKLEVSLD